MAHEIVTVLPLTEALTPVGDPGVPVTTVGVEVGFVVVVVGLDVVVVVALVTVVVVVVGLDVVVVVALVTVVVVVGPVVAVVVVVDPMLVPGPPPKSALKAANAFGNRPLVMSLSWPPDVSLNEKMSVKATLWVATQLANWLMK